MEDLQREYIDTIRCSLKKETICDDVLLQQLLSDGALAEVDLEDIRCKSIPSEKAQTLYDMMKTRRDGYVAMVKALANCNQAAAHQILLQGYAYCLSRNTPINFLGKTKKLSEYFDDTEIQKIIGKAKLTLSEKQLGKSYAYPKSRDDEITLVGNPEPPLPPFYIPRKLFKRVVINRRLFQAESSDVFVFKGFHTLGRLEALVHPQRSSLSSSYLAQDTITARFIFLENDEHWERIMNMTSVPTHLVKYEENTSLYILETTTGGSKIICQHLERPQDTTVEGSAHKLLSEDDFIDGILDGARTENGVCICDSPGMGKSFLLANLAHKIIERCPEKLVAFISLPHFLQQLTSDGIPLEVGTVYARNAILEYFCTSPLSFCILDRILQKFQIPIELFLDGFDEVNSKHMEFTKQLLGNLPASFQNARVIVTSRPNMRSELETTLGVIAYDIAEFTEAMQIEFLVNYWGNERKEFNSGRLAEFARYCLESLSGSLSKEERTVTGIPLLCRLFAEVYSRNAKRFARADGNAGTPAKDSCQFETSLPSLYANYVEASFEKFNTKSDLILEVKQYHIWKALQSIFPEFESEYRRMFSVNSSQDVIESTLSMGLLEHRVSGNRKTVEFVHRTLAEYFVAEYIAKTLTTMQESAGSSEDYNNIFIRFLFEDVLVTKDVGETDDVEGNIFINSVVAYFLNYFTEIVCRPTTFRILAQHFPISISPTRLYSMLFGCLRNNYENVFRIIKSILPSLNTKALRCFKDFLIPDGDRQLVVWLINVASVSSSIALVDTLFAMFKDCFSYSLETVCNEMPLHLDTPLHFAIERADVEKIQYFAKVMSLKKRKLLLSSVIRSNDDSSQIVKRKVEMCRMLLSMDKDLLSEAAYTLYDSVHVEILKVLIEAGADPRATKSEHTVVHFGAKYMSSTDFHELCRFLIVDCKLTDLFKSSMLFWRNWCNVTVQESKQPRTETKELNKKIKNCTSQEQVIGILRQFAQNNSSKDLSKLNEQTWRAPLPVILSLQKKLKAETLQMIMNVPGIDVVDEMDDFGTALFLTAVKHNRDERILAVLAENGTGINEVNGEGQNALHFAIQFANIQIIRFLVNLGVDCKHCDKSGNSFLHYSQVQNLTAEEYHEIISLLLALEKSDVLHMKNMKGQLPIHIAVASFEVKAETLQILKSYKVDFNSVDNDGHSLLLCAVYGRRSVQFLKILMDMGVDVMLQNFEGANFAHAISHTMYYSEVQYHELVNNLIVRGHEKAFLATDIYGRTPLHVAVIYIELLPQTLQLIREKLVECNNVNINATDKSSRSVLLHAASGRRSPNFLRALINMGADGMIQDKDCKTIAHAIAQFYSAEEYHEILELLIETGYGRLFRTKDSEGNTPLHCAVRFLVLLPKTLELVKVKLVQTGEVNINSQSKVGFTIHTYSLFSHTPMLNMNLLTPIQTKVWKKEDTDFLIHRSIGDYGSFNVPKGNWSVNHLRLLVEMGADLFIQNSIGFTFAHYAPFAYSAEEYHDLVEFLVTTKNESVFQIVDEKGFTPIHVAILKLELLDETLNLFNSALFQTRIVDINTCANGGRSFLAFAAKGSRSVKFVRNLLKMGVDVTIRYDDGYTFAHALPGFYTANQYHDIVKILLDSGRERAFQIVDAEGACPLHAAMLQLELLDETLALFNSALFQTRIVDINCCTAKGYSFLRCAVIGKRSIKFLESLMKLGIDVLIPDNDDVTFAHMIPGIYSPNEYDEIVKLLLQRGQESIFGIVNENGRNPLHIALYHLEILNETLNLFNTTLFKTSIVDINSCDTSGTSLLLCATAGKRSVQFLDSLIKMGADIMIQNKDGDTFAHFISQIYTPKEYHEIVELLLYRGKEKVFQIFNKNGQTPLHMAIKKLELLDETLNLFNSALFKTKIVDVNCCTPKGESFLVCAAVAKRSVHVLESLMKMGVDPMIEYEGGYTLAHFISAVYNPNEYHEIVQILLQRGHEGVFKIRMSPGHTPLHIAMLQLELLDETLNLFNSSLFQKNIVDINSCDSNGSSLLILAVSVKRSVKFLENLMKLGVDPMIQNVRGDTFLHLMPACYSPTEYHEMLLLVVETGHARAMTIENIYGMTPLHLAVWKLELLPETVDLFAAVFMSLINYEALDRSSVVERPHGLNALTKDGNSVLHWALTGKRSLELVKYLVNLGANWSIKNKNNSSLAHVSAYCGLVEHLKYFVELGCDIDAIDNDGYNVILCTLKGDSDNAGEMVSFLLERKDGINK